MSSSTPPIRITSPQNQRIKDVVRLNKRNERDRRRQTLVEGRREATRALAAGICPLQAFLCSELLGQDYAPLVDTLRAAAMTRGAIHDTTPEVFARLAYRGESGGVVLVVPYFDCELSALPLPAVPLLLVVEGVEKPGNLGAILRTADAAGIHGVIITEGATDLHNPNTIRAALGASFTVPVAHAPSAATATFLQDHKIRTIATTPDAALTYWDTDLRGPLAILLGSEAHGLSDFWLQSADACVRLPMHGAIDSLNLSTATAIVIYEALRQRRG